MDTKEQIVARFGKKKRKKSLLKKEFQDFGTPKPSRDAVLSNEPKDDLHRSVLGKKYGKVRTRKMFQEAKRATDASKQGGERAPKDPLMLGTNGNEYVKDYKRQKRTAFLDRHVPTRHCPVPECDELCLESPRWRELKSDGAWAVCVATGRGLAVVCDSCFKRLVTWESRRS